MSRLWAAGDVLRIRDGGSLSMLCLVDLRLSDSRWCSSSADVCISSGAFGGNGAPSSSDLWTYHEARTRVRGDICSADKNCLA